MFWTFGYRGRPARPLTEVLAELIDASSVGGASFDLGSACFDTMCVVDGRLDAYVEPGPLLVEQVPGMREEFERVGGGAVLNKAPYDLAAAALIAKGGGGGGTGWGRRALRRAAAAWLGRGVPDVGRHRRQSGAPRGDRQGGFGGACTAPLR